MSELCGVGIGLGVVQGLVVCMVEVMFVLENILSIVGVDVECVWVCEVVLIVVCELNECGEVVGGVVQEVFEVQVMIVEDLMFQDEVDVRIDVGVMVEWVVYDVFVGFCVIFEVVGGYLGEWVVDFDDIVQWVFVYFCGVEVFGVFDFGYFFVLVVCDFVLVDIVFFDFDQVFVFIMMDGGLILYIVIFVREKGIVVIVGVGDVIVFVIGDIVIVDVVGGVVMSDLFVDEFV